MKEEFKIDISKEKEDLFDAYTSSYSLEDLINKAEHILNNPLALFNVSAEPIILGERFNMQQNDSVIGEIHKNGFIDHSFFQNETFREYVRSTEKSQKPFTFSSSSSGIIPRRVHNIYMQKNNVGHISMLIQNPMNDKTDLILSYICQLVVLDMRSNPNMGSPNNPDEAFLQSILADKYKTEFGLKNNLFYQNFHDIQTLYAFVLPLPNQGALSTIQVREFMQLLQPECKWLKQISYQKQVIILVNCEKPGLIGKNIEALETFCSENHIIATVSPAFYRLIDFKPKIEQAEENLSIAKKLSISEGFVHGHSLYFQRIVNKLECNVDIFCLPQIAEFDKQTSKHTYLLDTIYEYMNNCCSLTQTAKALDIHRNSLVKRLEKFKEITGLDIESGEEIMKIYFSLLLIKYSKQLS